MPPETAQKKVDITSLEMAFAKDPASDAFLSLSEAYLSQGRFMEAMVVCKKGIKSKPECLDGRLLLTRIYTEQGKLPKAQIELDKLLADYPEHVPGLIFKAGLLDKQGDGDAAVEAYKQALELDPDASEAADALKEKGIDFTPSSAAPPEPPPAPAAPPAAAPVQPGAVATPPPGQPGAVATQPPAQVSTPPVKAWTPPPPQSAGQFGGKALDPNQGLEQAKKRGPGVTLGIVAAGIAVLGVFFLWFALHARELRKIDELNKDALSLISKDTSKTLGEAIEKIDEVLKLDDEQEMALGIKAFATAVRGFEHGLREDKDALTEALKKAEGGSKTSWRFAAEIMATHNNGDPEGAETMAKEVVEKGYATVSTFVAFAQAAQANGHLNVANQALRKAREAGPTSVRAQVASAEYYRRVLQIPLAQAQYSAALKTSPDHAMALAGRAILALENPTQQNLNVAYRDWQTIRDIGRSNIGPTIWGRAKTVDAFTAKLLGKNDDAVSALKDAQDPRTGGPEDADIWYMSGRVQLLMKNSDKALAALKKSAKIDNNRVSTHVMLARSLTEAGKSGEAAQALARARKLDPENVQIVISEAVAKREARKYDDAIKLLTTAAKEHGGDVSVNIELLDTYQAAGKHSEVLKQFKVMEEKFGDVASVMARSAVIFGQSLLRQRDTSAAANAFSTAVKMDPRNAEAYYYKGYALKSDKRSGPEAYAAFQKYLELAPEGEHAARAKKYAEQVK